MLHRLAFRLNRRVLATTAAVAVVVVYLVAAVTTLAALHGSRDVLAPGYHEPAWLVHGDRLVDAHHAPGTLPDVEARGRLGWAVTVQGPDGPVVAVATAGEGPDPGTAWSRDVGTDEATLSREGRSVTVTVDDRSPGPYDPAWLRVHPDDLAALDATGGWSFVVLEDEPADLPEGFHATPMRGVVPFFEAGARQAQAGLIVVVAVSIVVVAVLLHHLMSREVEERRHDIGVLGGIGARSTQILGLFVLQAAFIALVGFAFGATGASALTRVLVRVSDLARPGTGAWLTALVVGLGVTLAGTAIGIVGPVRRAARSTVVENLGGG